MSPHQYAASLRVATTDPEMWSKLKSQAEEMQVAARLAASARGWASSFAPLSDNFQVGVSESLLLANDPRVMSEFLSDAGDKLIGRLKTLADPQKQADCAFRAVLGRTADAEERQIVVAYLTERRDRPVDAIRQVVWSLLASSEFRFNH